MKSTTHTADLVEEVEESLEAVGYVGLHEFSWSMRGLRRGLREPEIDVVCHAAYDVIVARHDLTLAWVTWPVDLASAVAAADDTPLVFDIDIDADPSTPMLALIPR